MNIEVTPAAPASVEADLLALATSGTRLQDLDTLLEGRLARAAADADPVAVVQVAALDAVGRGASGYGVRMLIELASRLAEPQAERS